MYAKIINNEVTVYPFTINQLKQENPNTSFTNTIEMDHATLAEFNVYRVFPTQQPEFDVTMQKISESTPVFTNNQWQQAWVVVDLTDEEKQSLHDSKAAEVRAERNRLLIESDWTQYKDISDEVSNTWKPYRQALRDVTSQDGFPFNVTWPAKSNAVEI